MKTRALSRKLLAAMLVLAMIVTLLPVSVLATVDMTTNGVSKVLSKRTYAIVPGVTETDLILNTDDGTRQNKGFVMEIDLSNPDITIAASYKDRGKKGYGLQTTTDQAKVTENALKATNPNAHVVGAINGDFFNMSTGEPTGVLVMQGEKFHETAPGYPYFAIMKDGTARIFNGATPVSEDVQEAMAGFQMLVWDGQKQITANGDPYTEDGQPRTAIGIRADGSVVMFVCDGRQAPSSIGMSCPEVADTMAALGCVYAINLDGGGSTTFVTEREGSGQRTVKNSPSDGFERLVSGSLMVVSTAEPSGTFNHASIGPSGSVYTPGSTVNFTAVGVDATGGAAELPEDITWALSEDSANLGTIDETTGVFVGAENAMGTVTVQTISGGEVVGATTIELQAPDKIEFMNESVNLDYEQTSDLGLVASYGGVAMEVKPGDFIWSIGDESAGSFNGNIFEASPNNAARNLSVTTTVTATSAWDRGVYGSVTVGVGTAPVVVMDGGETDGDGLDYENVAYVHANANGGGLAYENHADDHGNVIVVHYINGDGSSRGGVASARQVDIDSGEVRFGEKALRLDYDYTNINGIEGACVGFDHDIEIPGNPTGIGVWVYAPENTANLWVRIRVRDGAGTIQTLNFGDIPSTSANAKGSYGGIDWVGWKYLECDLSNVVGPITLLGGETIRIMHTNGGATGSGAMICQLDDSGAVVCGPTYVGRTSGYLYLDNLQLVYGTNNADTDNPLISKITAGENLEKAAELAADGSTVIESNEVTFYSEFSDVQNKNTTGVELAYIYLDGVNMSTNDNCAISLSDGKLTLNAMKLANGTHSVKMLVRDGYGNEATITRSFTVAGNDDSLTSVDVKKLSEKAPLGGTFKLALVSNNVDDVKSVDMTMSITDGFEVTAVDFEPAFAGSTWDYDKDKDVLTLHAARAEGDAALTEAAEDPIATISVAVPATLSPTDHMQYRVTNGSVSYETEKDDAVVSTFASATTTVDIAAAYEVSIDIQLVGAESGTITVVDADGNPAADVEVWSGDTFLGKTDENGVLVTDKLVQDVSAFSVYAMGEDGYSYPEKGQSFGAATTEDSAKPYFVIENVSADGSTMQNLAWMANPTYAAQAAKLRYGTSEAQLDQTAEGESALKSFAGSGVIENNAAVLINTVVVTGLTPATTYYYQVGDGETWSEVKTFTTAAAAPTEVTKFFVLGDTQTAIDERGNSVAINQFLGEDTYDFGLQTGDAVETPALYSDWEGFLEVFGAGAFGKTDMMHAIGNHEQFADEGATAANAIFNTDGDCYSAVYGNCYVASISYTEDRTVLEAYAAWLIEDAAKYDVPWKLVVMHHPPYYTNQTNDIAAVTEIIAPAVDEAGIDMVFSGHDHSYARTEPMTEGVVDERFGAVYYICGTTGEKKYYIENNPDYNFAVVTGDFDALYLTVSATAEELAVETYNVAGGESTLFDSYTMKKFHCKDGEHELVYDRATGIISCNICGDSENAKETAYSDFIRDAETGRLMYLISGEPQTGYQYVSSEPYYFDEDGLGYEGDYTMCGETVTFKDGQYVAGSNPNVILAGKAGETSDFIVTTDGVLIVDGTGKTYAHQTAGTVQWYKVRGSITSVRVGADMTGLGAFTFAGLYNLTEVYFEEDCKITNVPNYCFAYDSSIETIILPSGVQTFGFRAFAGDTKLSFLYVPDGVYYFGPYVFVNTPDVVMSVADASRALSWAKNNNMEYLVRDTCEGAHDWSEWTYYTCADNDETGYRICAACGEVELKYGPEMHFTDVPADAYYADDVQWAVNKGITVGTSDTTFSPDMRCTRAQMVTFLWRAAGEPEPTSTEMSFTDVAEDAYYYKAVLWAVENNITYGMSDTTFGSDAKCTRAQAVTFMWRAAGEPKPTSTEMSFTDVAADAYYYDAVLWAVENGITLGTSDTTFSPDKSCTRAQMVAFLHRDAKRS